MQEKSKKKNRVMDGYSTYDVCIYVYPTTTCNLLIITSRSISFASRKVSSMPCARSGAGAGKGCSASRVYYVANLRGKKTIKRRTSSSTPTRKIEKVFTKERYAQLTSPRNQPTPAQHQIIIRPLLSARLALRRRQVPDQQNVVSPGGSLSLGITSTHSLVPRLQDPPIQVYRRSCCVFPCLSTNTDIPPRRKFFFGLSLPLETEQLKRHKGIPQISPTMGFGIRASYHSAQQANPRQPPVCPCARCFNGDGEEHALRAACRSPAAAMEWRLVNPFSGLRLGRVNGLGLGLGRGRKRSMDTMASDLRPLEPGHSSILEES